MSVRRIAPREAAELLQAGTHVYVDVRSEAEFELGHPAGAYNVPWQHQGPQGMTDNPDFLKTMRRAFVADAALIIGCRTGHRSLLAAARLLDAGFAQVLEMRGGYAGRRDAFGRQVEEGWCAIGLPTAVDSEPGRSYRELCGEHPGGPEGAQS